MPNRQRLQNDTTITFSSQTFWPDDYPGMTLFEALKYEEDRDVWDLIEYDEAIRGKTTTVVTELPNA